MNNKFFGFLSFTGIISFFSYIYFHQKNKIKELEKLLNRDVKFNMDIIEIKNHTTEEINPNLIYDDEDSLLNQTVINNGIYQWIYLKEMNEVQIIKNEENNQNITPHKLFNFYEFRFGFKLIIKMIVKMKMEFG